MTHRRETARGRETARAVGLGTLFLVATIATITACPGSNPIPATDARVVVDGLAFKDGLAPSGDGSLADSLTDLVYADGCVPKTCGSASACLAVPDGCGAALFCPCNLPGSGAMQSETSYVLAKKRELQQGFWRGGQGWSRVVPLNTAGAPDWSKATSWAGPLAVTGLPGSGTIHAQTSHVLDNTLHQAFWRGDQGWSRTVPLAADGAPDWSKAGAWGGPLDATGLPGSGLIQSQVGYVLPTPRILVQGFWRGGEGWSRDVPLKTDGSPDWPNASAWSGPLKASAIPGATDIQAQAATVLTDQKLLFQTFWRADLRYQRDVPIKSDGTVDWSNAKPWNGPFSP